MKSGLILHTCDDYQFLWDGWYHYFTKYWNHDVDIYFVNEEVNVDYPGIKQLKTGKGEWSDRLIYALDRIPNEIVMYMQEDFWAIKKLPYLKGYLQLFQKIDADCLRVHGSLLNRKFYHTEDVGLGKNVLKFQNTSPYLMSHQFGIWKNRSLKACLEPNESPWVNEKRATKRLRNMNLSIYGINNEWYEAVCRKGKLTERGVMLINKIEDNGNKER